MSCGEINSNPADRARSVKLKDSMRCPVCGKIAASRYFSPVKKKFVYRHPAPIKSWLKGKRRAETTYHEANL